MIKIVIELNHGWLDYEVDDTWGKFNENNSIYESMMSLIKDNKLDLVHFFRHFGFGKSCVACIAARYKRNYKRVMPYP